MYFTYLIVNILITKLFLNKNFFHFPLFNILCSFIFTIVDQVCIGRLFSVLYYYYSNCLRVIHIAIKPHKVNIETKNSSFPTSLVFGGAKGIWTLDFYTASVALSRWVIAPQMPDLSGFIKISLQLLPQVFYGIYICYCWSLNCVISLFIYFKLNFKNMQ